MHFRVIIFLLVSSFFLFGTAHANDLASPPAYSIVASKKNPSPSVIVIFGATGDLAARKIFPALYNLSKEGSLSPHTVMVGIGRKDYTDSAFRVQVREKISKENTFNKDFWNIFENKIFYRKIDFDENVGYKDLHKFLANIDQDFGTRGNRIYYLATFPSYFSTIIKQLHTHQFIYDVKETKWSKVLIEKPFGRDLASAIALEKELSTYLDESQMYRIDHYLGKEGLQNAIRLRLKSEIFESIWNAEHIDHVQITLSETLGIGSRASYWEETGLLRDVFQNHLMQLLSIIAMEPPTDLSQIHQEKIKLLHSIRPLSLSEIDHYVIRGQYSSGNVEGVNVSSYHGEKNVSPTSEAETFIATKFYIDNKRWKGVPFYIRAGKRMPIQTTEIAILFKEQSVQTKSIPSAIFIRIQPNAKVFLKFASKVPGENRLQEVLFDRQMPSQEAYEKLLYDCIRGDKSLFIRAEEHLAAWRLLTPILQHWKTKETIPSYPAGTWGPVAAEELLHNDGRQWHLLD